MNRQERKEWYYNQTHKIIEGVIYKQCTQCKEWKIESEEFYLHNKSKPEKGYSPECKVCAIKRADEIQRKNYGRTLEQQKRYDSKPERLPIRREYAKKIRESGYYKEYFKKYPEKYVIYNETKSHKKHKINSNEWQACLKYFNYSCAYCGLNQKDHWVFRKGKLINMSLHKEHVDHEGSNDLSNCVPSCQHCNDTKWKFSLNEWYNTNNENFSEERLEKIMNWITTDYKQYIDEQEII